jgi:hypothetical protein
MVHPATICALCVVRYTLIKTGVYYVYHRKLAYLQLYTMGCRNAHVPELRLSLMNITTAVMLIRLILYVPA